nr:hypothetical protein BaRGS_032701 [Batillaria attramentaria]
MIAFVAWTMLSYHHTVTSLQQRVDKLEKDCTDLTLNIDSIVEAKVERIVEAKVERIVEAKVERIVEAKVERIVEAKVEQLLEHQRRQREKRNVERRAAGDCRCPPVGYSMSLPSFS